MFMDSKTQNYQDFRSFQYDLQILGNRIQNPTCSYFVDINKLILKFILRGKTSSKILKKKNNQKADTTQLQREATVLKTVWHWHNKKKINGIEQKAQKQIHTNAGNLALTKK